jgi:hypothetical protein
LGKERPLYGLLKKGSAIFVNKINLGGAVFTTAGPNQQKFCAAF